jgi:hypothetical protein
MGRRKMKQALIFKGGWKGHEPDLVAERFAGLLKKNGYKTEIHGNQECLADAEKLEALDLIIPHWTMGEINNDYVKNISNAVAKGVGLAGCHGGMCDAFRQSVHWQFITGGNWVSHPGSDGVDYTVNICKGSSPIVEGLDDFHVCSEHYYLHVDPAIEVLATTRFPAVPYYHIANKPIDMPVVWTKHWGLGRVFYTSLGHHDDVFDKSPNSAVIMKRGMLWAAEGKAYAQVNGLTTARFLQSDAKMF